MIQTQTKTGRWRRSFGWFGRHKVTTVFVVLALALGLYLGVSEVVWRVEVGRERGRFLRASIQLDAAKQGIRLDQNPTILRRNYCSYTTPTSLFTTGVRSCDVQLKMIYTNISREDAGGRTNDMHAGLARFFSGLRKNEGAYDTNNLAVYNFNYQGLECFYSSSYYDSSVPEASRDPSAPTKGVAVLMEVDCGKNAKAEYFPVTTD